jgi:hypothetical protein
MTTVEWIYGQTILTDLALDNARTPDELEFVLRRLRELQGRVRFEQRRLARGDDPIAEWIDFRLQSDE